MATRNIKALQNQRRAQRYPTRFFGTIIVDRRSHIVEIADISRVGACLRGLGLPGQGAEILLVAQELEVAATVVWSGEAACGINFHETIEPLVVVRRNMFFAGADPFARAQQMRP